MLYDKLNFQFYSRHCAGCEYHARAGGHGGSIPHFQLKTVPEFIAYAKANPGGTPSQMGIELFSVMAGFSIIHVLCRDSVPMLTRVPNLQAETGMASGYVECSGSVPAQRCTKI